MNAWILLLPFFIIRFGLLRLLSVQGVQRARYFAPTKGNEIKALVVYQIANVFIFGYPITLHLQEMDFLIGIGYGVYSIGILVLIAATIAFARTKQGEMTTQGIYQYSRNPMYVGYFACFLGCAIITRSIILFLVVMVFQIATHWIILSEERWCLATFGNSYIVYKDRVRRYI